eukprot:9487049-Pyramimonas_sp.AAC.1
MLSGGSQWWRHPWVVLGIQPSGVGHKKEDGRGGSEEKEVDESEEEENHEKQMSGGGTELHERHGYTNAHGPTAAIALHCTALCLHVHLNGHSQLEDDPLAMSGSRPAKRRRVLPATFSAFTAPQTSCNE